MGIRNRIGIGAAVVLCVAWLAMVMGGCRFEQKHAPMIVVSVQPQKVLLERIAGSCYEVHSMLGSESDPDSFEPNASHMMWLEGCEAYFAIGGIGYETALMTRIDDVRNDVKVFDNTKGISMLAYEPMPGYSESNPYVWMSVKNCKVIAKNMLDALTELNPKKARYFRHRYNKLAGELNAVDNALAATLDTCRGRAFVEVRPTLAYFARDYGLRDVALLPGPDGVVSRGNAEACRRSGAKVFFVQSYANDHRVDDYDKELGLGMVELDLMSTGWLDGLQKAAKTMARAGR